LNVLVERKVYIPAKQRIINTGEKMVSFRYFSKNVEVIPIDDKSEYALEKYKDQLRIAIYEISKILATQKLFARECRQSEIIETLISEEKINWKPGAYYINDIRKILLIPDVVEDEYDREICIVMEPIEEEEDP